MFCTMFYSQEKNCEGYGALNTCPSIGVAIPLIGEVPHVIFEKVSFVVVTWRLLEVYKPSGSTPRRERVLVHRSVWYRSNHQVCCSSTLWNGWVITWMIRYTVSKMNPQRATTVTVPCAGVDYPVLRHPPRLGCPREPHSSCLCAYWKVYSALQTLGKICLKNCYYPRTKVTYTIVELPTLLDIECLSCDWLTEQPIGVYRLY